MKSTKQHKQIFGSPESRKLSYSEVLELRKRSLDPNEPLCHIRDIISSGDEILIQYNSYSVIGFVGNKIVAFEVNKESSMFEFEIEDVESIKLSCRTFPSGNYED